MVNVKHHIEELHIGKSSEAKPTPKYVGERFYETDTRKEYIYTKEGWVIWDYSKAPIDPQTMTQRELLGLMVDLLRVQNAYWEEAMGDKIHMEEV